MGDSRFCAPSRTGVGVGMSGPRFREPKHDTEDDEMNHPAESFYSEAGGSDPHHRSIAWTTIHMEGREAFNPYDESEDAGLNGEMHGASLRQRSRSRGRPTTRDLIESTPLETVPGSYLESPANSSARMSARR